MVAAVWVRHYLEGPRFVGHPIVEYPTLPCPQARLLPLALFLVPRVVSTGLPYAEGWDLAVLECGQHIC